MWASLQRNEGAILSFVCALASVSLSFLHLYWKLTALDRLAHQSQMTAFPGGSRKHLSSQHLASCWSLWNLFPYLLRKRLCNILICVCEAVFFLMTVQRDTNYRNETGNYKDSVKKKILCHPPDFWHQKTWQRERELRAMAWAYIESLFSMGEKCLKWECRTRQADLGSNTVLGKSRSRLRSHWIRDLWSNQMRSWVESQQLRVGFR